jgi:tetratricopeptide (TPR) repeat protein
LEKLLDRTPNHPGANHYYIHVMEPSPYALRARPSADRLGKLTPGLSHTVHMPSHIYLRTGEYAEGIAVNENAVRSYKKTIPLYAPVTGADFLYIIHNLHMQTNHAMLAGRMEYSVKSAIETRNSIPKDYLSIPGALGNAVQYIYMTPELAYVRFGKWNDLLATTQPDSMQVYANILYHFGRGMAYANTNNTDKAGNELNRIKELMNDSTLRIPLSPFSAAFDGCVVAANILAGTIRLKDRKFEEAITHFEKAVTAEENMVYNEPRDWLLNPKHYLGNALIKAGRNIDAEKVFKADLLNNSENGWALHGLYEVYLLLRRKADAEEVLGRFRAAFERSDIKIKGAVF